MALSEDEVRLIDESIEAYRRMINHLEAQIKKLKDQKVEKVSDESG